MSKEVILTGLRSNSEFHLGNYLGAILPMVELQRKHAGEHQLNMFVPDLHSITTPIDHNALYEQSIENLEVFIAAGLDISQPDTYVYRQSYIPAHSEMTWILDCFAGFGELSRMAEFKEKSPRIEDLERLPSLRSILGARAEASVGLFNYPILMAADILLYDAQWVPVGEDQRQHLELTRDLAIRMNNKFGGLFTVPHEWQKQLEFVGIDKGIRIRSLRNPEKKMSKSVEDPAGTILLSDNPERAAAKVISATTDSEGVIHFNFETQPGIANLLQILAFLSKTSQAEISRVWEGKSNYAELKTTVAEAVKDFLTDFQTKLANVSREAVLKKLKEDEAKMAGVTAKKLRRVQEAVGLRPKQ